MVLLLAAFMPMQPVLHSKKDRIYTIFRHPRGHKNRDHPTSRRYLHLGYLNRGAVERIGQLFYFDVSALIIEYSPRVVLALNE